MNTLLSIIITPILGFALLMSLIFASPSEATDTLYRVEPQATILVNGQDEVIHKTTWVKKTPVEIRRQNGAQIAPVMNDTPIEVMTGRPVTVYMRGLYMAPGAQYNLVLLNWTPTHWDIVESGILGDEPGQPFRGLIQSKFSDKVGFRLNPAMDVPPGIYTLNFSALSTVGRGAWHDFSLTVKVLSNGLAK